MTMPDRIEDALDSYYVVDDLRSFAGKMEMKKLPSRKGEIISLISNEIRTRRAFDRLTEIERKAFAEAIHDPNGELDLVVFRARHGVDPYKRGHEESRLGLRSGRSTLLDAFIIRGIVPNEIRTIYLPHIPPPEEDVLATHDKLPDSIAGRIERYNGIETFNMHPEACETESAALQNLEAVLYLAESGKLRVSAKTRRPSAATINAISKVLVGGDFLPCEKYGGIQAFAWPLLLQAAGFVSLHDTKLAVGPKGRETLNGRIEKHKAIQLLWNAWLSKAMVDEFSRIESIKGQNSKGRPLTAVKERRKVIYDTLRDCPSGTWIEVTELGRHMQAEGIWFEVSRDPSRLYFSESHYGSLGHIGMDEWRLLQHRYIQALLMEYAATLGLVDIAYVKPEDAEPDFHSYWGTDDLEFVSRYDGLLLFRINSLGEYALGRTETYTSTARDAEPYLLVQSNMSIVLKNPDAMPPGDRLYLATIATSVSPFEWRISPQLVRDALSKGEHLAKIAGFLQSRCASPLPRSIQALLGEAEASCIPIVQAGKASLLTCSDKRLIAAVGNDVVLKKISAFVDNDRFMIYPNKDDLFYRRLRDIGYSPTVTEPS